LSASRSKSRASADATAEGNGYHHGALRASLLAVAAAMLEAGGIPALTLRGVSRAAGVSHAAPAHHFGDLTGLLSELAGSGFVQLRDKFDAAMAAAGADGAARLTAMGKAYVGFARAHPGLFALMFRSESLDMCRPVLRDAVAEVREALRRAAGEGAPGEGAPGKSAPSGEALARSVALWSLVHGFAVLLIDDRLRGALATLPQGADADTLLDAVLDITSVAGPHRAAK